MEINYSRILKVNALAFAITICAVQYVNGQLTITPSANATTLANRIKGQGVTITNPQKSSPPGFTATFDNGSTTNIGVNSGIILSTGVSAAINGNAANLASTGSGGAGNALLDPLAGSDTYDAAVLEFDMVPECGTLQIRFVFGSEEYPGYVGSPYNDAFGFFITGPNPEGGNYTDENIALIPSTNTPISVNTINMGISNTGPCVNCSYYVDNTGGTKIKYNGFTTPFTSRIKVVPGASYHMTLAIADADDDANDASVLVAYEGLDCPASLPVELTSFTVNRISEGNVVEWITTNDPNVDYFVIERSDDGKLFEEISKVYPVSSQNGLPTYYFKDQNLRTSYYTPYWYYRLRVVDKSGAHEYMNQLVSVENISVINSLVNSPVVPEDGMLELRFKAENIEIVQIQIKDMQGNLLIEQDFQADQGQNHTNVNMMNLPSGLYLVSLKTISNSLISRVLKN